MQAAKRFKSEQNYNESRSARSNPEAIVIDQIEPDQKIFVEFTSISYKNIDLEFQEKIIETTEFETLEVTDIPTLKNAVALLSQDLILQHFYQSSYSIAIRLKINDTITTLSPLQHETISTKTEKSRRILVCFESTIDGSCCICWKNYDDEQLLILSLSDLEIDDKNSMNLFLISFLLLSLRCGNDGILQNAKFSPSINLSIFSLGDVIDKNLLMLAAEHGNLPVVNDLLKIGFDVNFQVDNQIAADFAWQNRHLDVLLALLLENSLYPMGFNEANTSNEMKEFVRLSHKVLRSVRNNEEENVKEILYKYPNLRHFYSLENMSAAFLALSKEKFNIYKIFMDCNVSVGPKEDIDRVLSRFNDRKKEELRQIHLEYAREPPEKFLMVLNSNTSVGHDTINVNEKLNNARSAIEYLCRIPLIRLILQIVAASRNFKLIFDFNRESVQFIDPTSSKSTRGSFFTSRQVYIAAKYLLDPLRKQETIGTLAHELCHFAMFLVYGNNCMPYFQGDHKMERMFHGILKLCHENRKKERIVGYVFDIPKDNREMRHAELIVRVPHMLALYHEEPEHLEVCHELFLPLFSFYEFKVIEDMKAALPNIETEGDGEIQKFNDKRKPKGFFRMRNFVIVAIIGAATAIVAALLAFFLWQRENPVGDVLKPWNVMIRHSRTGELMCMGSLIHKEFVLTTAECVHKKGHLVPLPAELFTAELHYYNPKFHIFASNITNITVHPQWIPTSNTLYADISLLKLQYPAQLSEFIYTINLPDFFHDNCQETGLILHTFDIGHSVGVPFKKVATQECIVDDYTLNAYFSDFMFCAQQTADDFCVTGRGEQFYEIADRHEDILHGIVSLGPGQRENCDRDVKSLVITGLWDYNEGIRSEICSGSNFIESKAVAVDYIAAVIEVSTGNFFCWATFISYNVLITDSNCIKNFKTEDLVLKTSTGSILSFQEFQFHSSVELVKLVLTSDHETRYLIIPQVIKEIADLRNAQIIFSYQNISGQEFITKIYRYEALQPFVDRIFTEFCIQIGGGPILLEGSAVNVMFGIVTKKFLENYKNNINIGYVRLADHINWIMGDNTTLAPETTLPFNTSTPSDPRDNLIFGSAQPQIFCINEECLEILAFIATNISTFDSSSYRIAADFNETIEGFEISTRTAGNIQSLPKDVALTFPNLVTYSVTNCSISYIFNEDFINLALLQSILLNNNIIEDVEPTAFTNLLSLRILNLDDNRIASINPQMFFPIPNLEFFSINRNLLIDEIQLIDSLRNLKEFHVANNRISMIFGSMFMSLDSLEVIDLSANGINILNTSIFLNKANLRFVDLRLNSCVNQVFESEDKAGFTSDEWSQFMNTTRICWPFSTVEPQTTTTDDTNTSTTIA